MTRRGIAAVASAGALAGVLLLAGCSMFALGPERDSDGRVTKAAEINSADLTVGDCFSFIDGTNLARSTVVPCADTHALVVIGQGELDSATIEAAGGKQNAVNVACDEPFGKFKDAAADGVKPELQFIVSAVEKNGAELLKYSCVATDS